ncbi:MAG TPA: AAA family ATPase [Solirubrobacteraceae bacterium]|nr:AAA family ATPase [Solirubrobacteraceae bacterium]
MGDPAQAIDAKNQLVQSLDALSQTLHQYTLTGFLPQPSSSITSHIQDWANQWQAPLAILFMGVIAYVLWRTMKMMPRTKPVQIKPQVSQDIGWDDIAGVDEAKAELREVVEFLRNPGPFKKLGAKVPRGVMLHGPPGTGKTLLAKAVAHEGQAQFFSQSASSFVEMFAGLGAARIRRLFNEARKHEPCVIFIDELDAVGARRGSDMNSEREQTLNQLLVEMDGFASTDRIVVMAASNLLEKLDPALLRPGRFDRQVFVSPPDVKGRERILQVHTRNKPLDPDVDLGLVAQQTSGLTGADLANICNEAAIFAARRSAATIGPQDFDGALERVIAGVASSTTLNSRERRIVAYHEAGHALCRELLPASDRVHKISIVPRGRALGYVMNLPEEDSYLKNRDELVEQMAILLGGRVSEQIVFGAVTNGAANDLQRVAEITHAMVHQYAMGTSDSNNHTVSDPALLSDLTRRIRDEEQQQLAFEAQRLAWDLITSHREKLDEFADALLEREVLERAEIDEIMKDVTVRERRRSVAPPPPSLRVAAARSEQASAEPEPPAAAS